MTDRPGAGTVPVLRPQHPGVPGAGPHLADTTSLHAGPSLLRKLQKHTPNSTQMLALLTLVVSGGILLVLAGLTLTATVVALIFFMPLIVLSSPIWVPSGAVLIVGVAVVLTACGFGVVALAAVSWGHKYFRGRHPPGLDRLNSARSRIANTASNVKDYAREYGGYLRGRVTDAAPGA